MGRWWSTPSTWKSWRCGARAAAPRATPGLPTLLNTNGSTAGNCGREVEEVGRRRHPESQVNVTPALPRGGEALGSAAGWPATDGTPAWSSSRSAVLSRVHGPLRCYRYACPSVRARALNRKEPLMSRSPWKLLAALVGGLADCSWDFSGQQKALSVQGTFCDPLSGPSGKLSARLGRAGLLAAISIVRVGAAARGSWRLGRTWRMHHLEGV